MKNIIIKEKREASDIEILFILLIGWVLALVMGWIIVKLSEYKAFYGI